MTLLRIRFPGVAAAVVLLAGIVAGALEAQQGSIAGQVTDKASQQPVAGAQVLVSGTSLQTRTGRDGHYSITRIPAGTYTVQVRLIGYATGTSSVSVAPGGSATADFVLSAAAIPLDAVTISATGQEQLKRELGNNVGSIDATKVTQQAAPTTAADLLNSRLPGVEVMQSGGTTGSGSRIRIRGASSLSLGNEPIIVVDGVRIDNTAQAGDLENFTGGQAPSRLNDISPDDIESIEVVKGPSAAVLYGTDAANGVIQIRTKQGRPGSTKWTSFAEGGTLNDDATWPANYLAVDSAGGSCFLPFLALGICKARTKLTSFNPLTQNPPFREGVRQHYGVSASGGNEATTFYVAGDFQRERGIYQSNDLKQTNLRVNVRNQISRLMDLTANVGYVTSNLALPQNDNNDQGLLASGLLGFPDTTNGGYAFLTPQQANLISTTERIERFTGGLTLNFRPTSFLTMRGIAGYDATNQGDNSLTPPNVIPLDQSRLDGSVAEFRGQTFAYTANFSTTASFRLSSVVTSNTSVGVQYYKNVFQQAQASGRKIVAGTSALSGAVVPAVSSTSAPFVTLGGYVEEQVGVRERLYFTAALRADKNSSFGTNFSDIVYPKLSGSWVVSEEPFFPHPSWLSSLRLRAAWGKSGRAPGVLDALQYFNPVAVAANASDVPAITVGGAGNADLRPEQTREIETGFDVDLLPRRLHFEATYYNKATTDALVAVPIAGSLGVSSTRFENLGKLSNKGFEVALSAQVLDLPNVSWNLSVSAWGNKNRVLSTGPGNTPIIFGLGGSSQRLEVGYPAGGYWGKSMTFKDQNGDGLINPFTEITLGDSDTFQGSSVPTRGGTISTDLTVLRHFQLYGLLDGRWGNKLDNATEQFRCQFAICRGLNDPGVSLSDQAAASAAAFFALETPFFEDAGFVKLRELSLTYLAPTEWASRLGASALSFTVSGRNLVTWTNYRGVDPELNDIGQFNFSVADFLTQPPVRSFLARVNLTF